MSNNHSESYPDYLSENDYDDVGFDPDHELIDTNDHEDDDEQHTQKVNGQIELLQQKVDNLQKELINEKSNYNIMKSKLENELKLSKETINNNNIETSDQPSIEMRKELVKLCDIYSLDIGNNENDISSDKFIEILKTVSNKAIAMKSQNISSSTSNSNISNDINNNINNNVTNNMPSTTLRNEIVKFTMKNGIPCDITMDISTLNDEKCISVLKSTSKYIYEINNKMKSLDIELRSSLNSSEDIKILKAKLMQLVERIRIEKEHRFKLETLNNKFKKEIDILSDHIEKIVIHLKHEVISKVRAIEQLKNNEKEIILIKENNEIITKKSLVKDKLIIELREGSKILEDQLKLMDEKYLELRTKLDWAREIGASKVRKAEKVASELRVKYTLATNSLTGLDKIPLPDIYNTNSNHSYHDLNLLDRSLETAGSITSIQSNKTNVNSQQNKNNYRKSNSMKSIKTAEPTMEHVMEKLRVQLGTKREWTNEKLRKLANSK